MGIDQFRGIWRGESTEELDSCLYKLSDWLSCSCDARGMWRERYIGYIADIPGNGILEHNRGFNWFVCGKYASQGRHNRLVYQHYPRTIENGHRGCRVGL